LLTNLFFLIIILAFISNASPKIDSFLFPDHSWVAFLISLLLYLCILAFICQQCRWLKNLLKKERFLILVNLELTLFFICFFFLFIAQRPFYQIFAPFGLTFLSFFSLLLYFGGLAIGHYSYDSLSCVNRQEARKKMQTALRFLAPFSLPFLFFVILGDIEGTLPFSLENLISQYFGSKNTAAFVLSMASVLGVMIFFPPLLVLIWKCPVLNDCVLYERLEALCLKANFRHAGFRKWIVMEDSLTAAIVGIVPSLRYILFTERLLDKLSWDAMEAVLAHEIGHSYRKHLLLYPLILLGMIASGSLASLFFYEVYAEQMATIAPNPFMESLTPLAILLPFVAAMALYFRFVFGHFSRLFERQADLHIFQLHIPAENMMMALNEIAISSGFIHKEPNWHHYSIQERITFIKDAQKNPSLIKRHHQKVRNHLWGYFILLGLLIAFLNYPLEL
jgi:Zn-dependent protease with chaperone function